MWDAKPGGSKDVTDVYIAENKPATRRFLPRCLPFLLSVAAGLAVSGCASGPQKPGPNVASGEAAYAAMPAPSSNTQITDYEINPLDTLNITVFQEQDISSPATGTFVDASGNIAMPLIGQVHVSGLTVSQLSAELERRLTEKYYVKPQVSVIVVNSVAQQVTVEGEVQRAGVYPIKGPTTLLDTLALAQGETEVSSLQNVVIIRYSPQGRMAAVFDANQIRRGLAPDPAIQARDVVIVGYSSTRGFIQGLTKVAPGFVSGIFYLLAR